MHLCARRAALIAAVVAATALVPAGVGRAPALARPGDGAAAQDDASSGSDAGDTFDAATAVQPKGAYRGSLDAGSGDVDDFYRFTLGDGDSATVLITVEDALGSEPISLLDPNGVTIDSGVALPLNQGLSASGAVTTQLVGVKLAVHRALTGGDYRLHLSARNMPIEGYSICFMSCEEPQEAPIGLIFGGSLRSASTRVLLVPPAHGDLGNPAGPTVLDYIDATLRGMHRWVDALHAFADDRPEYSYLKQIDVDIEIFDGLTPVEPDGYDVIVGYVAAGPAFRGVASNSAQALDIIFDWNSVARYPGRVIALSLFGASPRAGQVLYDFPEVADLETVTMHEFGHTFGLGHTTTWHHEHGPDLMNSPATFVYGDGLAAGDGGERTPLGCFSSLDLYGMAMLYRWLPDGQWQPSYGSVALPKQIPYKLYC